jgi:hypothetical protein
MFAPHAVNTHRRHTQHSVSVALIHHVVLWWMLGAAPHHWQGQHKNARVAPYQPKQRGVTQLNARRRNNEAHMCNTLEMTMGRWGFFVGVQGHQNNKFWGRKRTNARDVTKRRSSRSQQSTTKTSERRRTGGRTKFCCFEQTQEPAGQR